MTETPRHSVSVAAAIFDESGENVLLIKRRDNGKWEPPGGVLELDETIEDGLRREVREETGAEIEVGPLTGVYKNMSRGIVGLVFRCSISSSVSLASEEAEEVAWHSTDTICELMDEVYAIRIEDARRGSTAQVRIHDGQSLLPTGASIPAALHVALEAASAGHELGAVKVNSKLTRAGRPFTPVAELDVLPSLTVAAGNLARSSKGLVIELPEAPLPVGIPDLTVLVANSRLLEARLSSPIPPILSEQESKIIAACGVLKSRSLPSLVRLTGVTERQTKAHISALVSKGALLASGNGWRRSEYLQPLGRSFALEAKVSAWKSGIAQCLRYATYADAAGLVIPEPSPRVREAAIKFARESRIGLSIENRWIVRPSLMRVPLHRRLWVSEHFVAAIRN